MLDNETKRRIDTARDILVGKVPDPKSQVEQITIALIYKFMDDMDAESEEFGGLRKFFANEFARYGWAKLMRSGLGGHETLNLYAEAITKMPENPGIPLLFREIFKNAYLPYRDPETLRAFLKIIDEFEYDHSERLGDAFEYLLSVLDSQGDAGQFRTPRHIIDFIVEVVDPKKNETILDPACGTAGFLISAYKHILRNNSSKPSPRPSASGRGRSEAEDEGVAVGDLLTPDDKGRLAKNFKGYDISPDMVRLSLVNLYLHGFADPHIYEYDTLTSEDKWNEFADVILANPPFMSPKGGIKPHKRFSVQSKRSEVLFVDYMAEHLTPGGRAGIIVPEGIIFQSQRAYKQLRKMLVEEYLVAVVSLPAGVFNPYSGVKTSILILDKALARQSDTIAFFKVENDGFGLGAQRRPIDKNDLPQARAEIAEYLRRLRARESIEPSPRGRGQGEGFQPTLGLVVPKEKIAANGDYNLSGERYREGAVRETKFPRVTLGDLLNLEFGTRITKRDNEGTLYPVYGGGGESFRTDTFTREDDVVISRFAMSAECVRVVSGKFYLLDSGFTFSIAEPFSGRATKEFVTRLLLNIQEEIYECGRGHAQKNIDIGAFKALEIPLPPLEVQKEIVTEIEGYQKVIDGARAVLDNYRPHIPIHPDWPKRNVGSLAENMDSRRVPITKGDRKEGPFPYYGASGIVDYVADFIFDEDILLISEDGANLLVRSTPIAFSVSGKCWVNNHAHVLTFQHSATQTFVEHYLNSISIEDSVTGAAQPKLTQEALNRIPIAIPDDVATQRAIVAEIEAEQSLVNANRELIARMEKKIQATLARVWGEDKGGTPK